MIAHYVTFYFPGTLFEEDAVRKLSKRGEVGEWPKGAHACQEWQRTEVKQDGETLLGQAKNVGPRVVLGVEYTLSEVEELNALGVAGDLSILLSNMRGNGWNHVVRTIRGSWQPVEKGTRVVHDERNALKRRRSLAMREDGK